MPYCRWIGLANCLILFGWTFPPIVSFGNCKFPRSLTTSHLFDSLFNDVFGSSRRKEDCNEGSARGGIKRVRQTSRNAAPPIGYNDDVPPFSSKERLADRARRMEMARSLQLSYYSQPSPSPQPNKLENGSTFLRGLPLYQTVAGSGGTSGDYSAVLPGYQFVWDIHQPQYSHMFHSILSGKCPWYFGHLCLPSEGAETENGSRRIEQYLKRGLPVVGTLMRITDRRFIDEDGRIVLTVQALEKFRLHRLSSHVGSSTYAAADVELWPDEELVRSHLDSALLSSASCISTITGKSGVIENEESSVCSDPNAVAGAARAAAIADAFRCRKFEFIPIFLQEKPRQPSPRMQVNSTLTSSSIIEYMRVSSLANYDLMETSSLENAPVVISQALRAYWNRLAEGMHGNRAGEDDWITSSTSTSENNYPNTSPTTEKDTLWYSFSSSTEDVEVMEFNVWRALDEMIRLLAKASSSVVVLPPQLLGLLPKRNDWPKEFVLEQCATGFKPQKGTSNFYVGSTSTIPFVRVNDVTQVVAKRSGSSQSLSPYSTLRRASRLSFSVWLLLEGLALTGAKPAPLSKHMALQMDSTLARLEAAKGSLDGVNEVLRKLIPRKN